MNKGARVLLKVMNRCRKTKDAGYLVPIQISNYLKRLHGIYSLCESLNLKWKYKQYKNKNKRDEIIIYMPKNKAGE